MKNLQTIRNLSKVNFSKCSKTILGKLILIALKKTKTNLELEELIVIAYKNDIPQLSQILEDYIILKI